MGEMKNILFLHGMPNTSKSVSNVVNTLSEKYNVISFDWMSNSTMSELTEKVVEKVKHLDSFNLFGMDWGGIIGPRVAYQLGTVEKIILCNTGFPCTEGCEFVFGGRPIEEHIKPTTMDEFEFSLNNLSNGNAFRNWVSYVQTTEKVDMKRLLSILTYYDHDVNLNDFVIHRDLPLQMDKELELSDKVKDYIEHHNNVYYIGSLNDPISSEGAKSFHFAKEIFLVENAGHLINLDQPDKLCNIISNIMENV